jgi:glutathione S-transferase
VVATTPGYVLHGGPWSLFTRKLEAALRLYGVPFESIPKGISEGSEIEKRAGSHQIPVLETPEGWALADTTPILDVLDARFPSRRLFPEGAEGVLVHVVEEILDEWIARVMVHYRWHHDANTRFVVGELLGREVTMEEAKAFPTAQWGPRACRATGTELPHHGEAAETEYLALVAALEAQLAETPWALGKRPTAADTILVAGLRAHTMNDPVPDLSAFGRVEAWAEGGHDAWDGTGELAPFPATTPFGSHVLALGRDHYAPFVVGNAEALAKGEKAFVIETYGVPCSYKTREYPERSRRMVQARIRDRLSAEERDRVESWLDDSGLACFLPRTR